MSRSKTLAILSVGFLTGYLTTKAVKWGLFIGWTVLVFLLGMLAIELPTHIQFVK